MGLPRFEISPKAARLKVKVENSKTPIGRPFTYIIGSLGVCGDVLSSHLFRAGRLQVISAQYWVS
jgi:hypothetical protein